jgi:hypothetical protein
VTGVSWSVTSCKPVVLNVFWSRTPKDTVSLLRNKDINLKAGEGAKEWLRPQHSANLHTYWYTRKYNWNVTGRWPSVCWEFTVKPLDRPPAGLARTIHGEIANGVANAISKLWVTSTYIITCRRPSYFLLGGYKHVHLRVGISANPVLSSRVSL